ncbi:MAG: FG-GAP-like repeat-containing protein [Actinomycetota bacterium]
MSLTTSSSMTRASKRLLTGGLLIVMTLALLPVLPAAAADPYDPFFATQTTAADFGATTRPFGVAAGNYDEDTHSDLVVGRTTGNVAFVKGNGDGTFQAPSAFTTWKLAFFNGWAFAPADINGDGDLDVVWGANATSTGCSVSPVPAGGCPATVTVNDGDVRALLGNGDGTFQETPYFVGGTRHNAGVLIGRIAATDAGSLTTGDVDGDGDADVVAGGVDGANSVVKLLRNDGGLSFTSTTLVSQATTCSIPCSPVYFPAISTQNSPWGLAFGDADGDGDQDLWVADRALYVYLFKNDGTGALTMQTGNSGVPATRTNAYLDHDSFRASVGFTPSLASGDLNGDGKADLVMGLHSGAQTPATGTANDGRVLLDVSSPSGHTLFGSLADIGTMARGLNIADVNGDGARDIVGAEYNGAVKVLRQLPPIDSDSDGVSDYVDNAPNDANAARIDMNTDSSINHLDQLDNDFDTVLGDPENPASWQRLGDPVDADDDNDGVADGSDNCAFTANGGQANTDGDARGDACDPLDETDSDGDGVPDGPAPGDPLYDESLAAKAKWSTGDTHFVIRIDALGRIFQNEFTQLMTDAATLSPSEWATKCWENYQADDIINGSPYEPCGTGEGTAGQTLTLDGGKEVPATVVVIPKQLWTDAPVVWWINDRNNNPLFEVGQHGTYHFSNTTLGDWKDLTDRNFFSCETCGLSEAENYEMLKVGYDTLAGNYGNKWITESPGADLNAPKIDWNDSANQLLTYAPPFNASDTESRKATAQLGFKAFSASIFEESPTSIGQFFSPEGSHHEEFDQFGMFHASADTELEPPETSGGVYDHAAYNDYLVSETNDGGLTTWLIEEVEWSGRPCNELDRLADLCNGGSNRENNTVYEPRWEGWLQLLDYVKNYEGGVAMTMQEVALAEGFDNAPTVANPGQTDSDHDGVGDVIAGATLGAADANLSRNQPGTVSATLTNGSGEPIAGQEVSFHFDVDGDSTDESFIGTTDQDGVATAEVTATRPVGSYSFSVDWDGGNGVSASDTASAEVGDATTITLDAGNPASGQVTDQVSLGATLVDSDGNPLADRTIDFSIGSATGSGTTDAAGHASASLTLAGPAGAETATATFAGAPLYGADSDSTSFTVDKEDTSLALSDAVGAKNDPAVAQATLTEADGAPVAGATIAFFVEERVRRDFVFTQIGTATTDANGVASFTIPTKYVSKNGKPIRATFSGDADFLPSSGDAVAHK